jgi:hypothetical protein
MALSLILFSAGYGRSQEKPKAPDRARLQGAVSDFDRHPVAGAEVIVKDAYFSDVAVASTDARGRYDLSVEKGRYQALYVCKDYAVGNLEFWAWNLMVEGDVAVDARNDGLEVYAVNAFLIQRSPATMQIYFRPMSLSRFNKAGGKRKLNSAPRVDIAPRLEAEDIQVSMNGEAVKVLKLNKVLEWAADGQEIWAYLLQAGLPARRSEKTWKICLTLRDSETGERGEGCLFWEKPGQYADGIP